MINKAVGSSCLPYYLCLFLDWAKKEAEYTLTQLIALSLICWLDTDSVCWLEKKSCHKALSILHFLGRD